jgi:hypothetical protein
MSIHVRRRRPRMIMDQVSELPRRRGSIRDRPICAHNGRDLPESMGEVGRTVPGARPGLQVPHLLGLGESLGTVSGPELDDGG